MPLTALPQAAAAHNEAAHAPERYIRHDGRSALHSIVGFVELLDSGALGALSHEQRSALNHVRGSALSLFELLESSLDLANRHPHALAEPPVVCATRLIASAVHSLRRDNPTLRLTFDETAPGHGLPVAIAADTLRQVLGLQLAVLTAHQPKHTLFLALDREAQQCTLTLTAASEAPGEANRSHDAPVPWIELEGPLRIGTNLDYVRLMRCHVLLARFQGRLWITGDLSRLRIELPLREPATQP